MSVATADSARRFITLLDELYNARCALLLTAAVPRELLFAGGDGSLMGSHKAAAAAEAAAAGGAGVGSERRAGSSSEAGGGAGGSGGRGGGSGSAGGGASGAGGGRAEQLEALQFEGESPEARSRRDVTQLAGVAPVAGTRAAMAGAVAKLLSGEEERFAFSRAVSRLAEMGTEAYLASRQRPWKAAARAEAGV